MNETKIVFMGTPEFSVPILEMLIENYNVVGVVTQPDKLVGRKKELMPSPIKKVAIDNDITVLTPSKLKNDYQSVLDLEPDIIVTCAYGQIVPVEILNYPKFGCINVHASLLPKYRGGAPIHHCIINGEDKTGITIMYMNEGLDTGDMIESAEITIGENDTYDIVSSKLKILGRDLLKKTLPNIISFNVERKTQDNEGTIYAPIITRKDEKINFNKTALEIHNHIRGLSSVPAAYAVLDNKIVKIYNSRVEDNNYPNAQNGEIVKIYKDGIGISVKDSEIVITDIKFEGKNRVLVKDYLNGKSGDSLLGKIFNEE